MPFQLKLMKNDIYSFSANTKETPRAVKLNCSVSQYIIYHMYYEFQELRFSYPV